MIPSIYLNLEDDVARIVTRIRKERSSSLVLVCPKRCYLFNDSINLRLLKKQADLLKKEVFILTMDERGQMYAKEAGFQLKFLPKSQKAQGLSDIGRPSQKPSPPAPAEKSDNALSATLKEIKNVAKLWSGGEQKKETLPKAKKLPEIAIAPGKKVSMPKVSVADTVFPREIEEIHKIRKKKSYNQKVVTSLVALSLVVILAVVFVVLPKATVVVYPKSEPLTRDLEVSIGTGIKAADASRLIMPASQVDQTLEVTEKFQSQGKKEVGNKASGTVRIYNFTRAPLNLKSGTTVLTVGSKSYLLVSDVNQLRPTAYKNARTKEVDESTLADPVEVIAKEGGDSYNLPEGTRMEISNQVFGSKPQFLYAKTASPIVGGTSRYLSVVTDTDINASKAALEAKLIKSVQDTLSEQGMVLPEKSFTITDLQFSTDKPAGTESPTFQATLRSRIMGIAFAFEDLKGLVTERIGQTLSSGKALQAEDKGFSYKYKSTDFTNQTAVLDVHFEGSAVYSVEINDIASQLVGKTQSQVNEILKSKEEIDRIEITLAPAWQRNFPWFTNKISVTEGKIITVSE